MLAHGPVLQLPRPQGVRLGYTITGNVSDSVRRRCPVVVTQPGAHEHPAGATARSVALYCVFSNIPDDSVVIVVGDSPTRCSCLQLANTDPCRTIPRNQWAVHTLRPEVSPGDAIRAQNAIEAVRAGRAFGTMCHCLLDGTLCEHVRAIVARRAHEAGTATVVFYAYDVPGLDPQLVYDAMVSILRYGREARLQLSVRFYIGCHQWFYRGTYFEGEYNYVRHPDGTITALVAGNGSVCYGPHSADDWIHTTNPKLPGLEWKCEYTTGTNSEVRVYRFALQAVGNNLQNVAYDDRGRFLPQLSYAYVNQGATTHPLPVPIELVMYLRRKATNRPRDGRLAATLTLIANSVVNGKDPNCKVDIPPHISQTVVTLVVADAMSYVSPEERDFVYEMGAAQAERAVHAERLTLTVGVPSSSIFIYLAFIALPLFLKLGFSTLTNGGEIVTHLGPGVIKVLYGAHFVIGLLTIGSLVFAYGMVAQNRDTRNWAWGNGWPVSRLFWTLVLISMLFTGAVAKPMDRDPFSVPRQPSNIQLRDSSFSSRELECGMPDVCCLDGPTTFLAYHSQLGVNRDICPTARYRIGELCPCEDKPGPTAYGFISHEVPVTVPAVCACNEVVSLTHRALMAVPGCADHAWDAAISTFTETFEEYRKLTNVQLPVPPTDWASWLKRPGITASLAQRFEAARETVREQGLTAVDYVREGFVKVEKWTKGAIEDAKEYAPRTIQGMSDALQVTIGPYFHAMSTAHHTIFNSETPILYAPGATAEEIGRWFSVWHAVLPIIVEGDAVRMDAHLKRPAFEAMSAYHRRMLVPSRIRDVLADKISTVGKMRKSHTKYVVDGTRKSGDSETTNENTDFTLASYMYCLERQGAKGPGTDYALAAAGDDVIILCQLGGGIDIKRLEQDMLTLGMVVEVSLRELVADATFLSALFYPSQDGVILSPMIGRQLSRLGWSATPQGDYGAYMWAVATGLHNATSHVPILRTLIAKMKAMGSEGEIQLSPDDVWKTKTAKTHEVSLDVYAFLEQRYGIGCDIIDQIEEEIATVVTLPHVWQHPAIRLIIDRDR